MRDIQNLFALHGDQAYDDSRREPVTATQHALQCAQLAEWAHADDALVAAAFLHDIGHFIAAEGSGSSSARPLSTKSLRIRQSVRGTAAGIP